MSTRMAFHGAMAAAMLLSCVPALSQSDAQRLEQQYQPTIRPLLVNFCGDCHHREVAEAELNLVDIDNWTQVKKQADAWQNVAAMLASDGLRFSRHTTRQDWVNETLDHTRLTHRFQGRDYRLTDVHGQVIHDILS